MRGIVAVGLAMVLAACASETPTATKQGTAGSAVRDIVLVNVWQRARDGSGLNDQRRLIVEQFPDRVSVAPDGDLAASATRPSTLRRAKAVGRPDIAALRERSGLAPVSARAMPSRASGRTWKGPRRYITRLVTADRSQRQLQDLRAHADAEERVGPTQLRFQRTEGDVAQTWVFDEAIDFSGIARSSRRLGCSSWRACPT